MTLRHKYASLLATLILLVTTDASLAHHGASTKFDTMEEISIAGRVSRVDWANPHAHIFMLVDRPEGELPWYVELESPRLLEVNGWSETDLTPGDRISVTGFPARDGSRQVWGEAISLTSSGTSLFNLQYPSMLSTIGADSGEAAPRWPDGQIRLGAPAGRAGYWIPSTNALMENGVDVPMAANGQLEKMDDAAKVAPLQEWALRLYERRQRNYLQTDPTYLECRPPSGPRKFLNAYGIQLLEDRQLDRIFVITADGNNDWHLIYTDGRELDSEDFQLDTGNLLYYGRNSAHWEGDTLVIESEGYNEKFWLPGGLPHSELMHATERLTRVSYDTMNIELTIDDPGTYTRPWSSSWTLRWLEGNDPPEHYCQDNRL